MKKLLILLFSLLISLNSYGEELKGLFGINLYDNAEKYVSSNYIDSNKLKNEETIEGYFNLNITDKIKTKSPFLSDYWITIDNDNRIHQIYGADDVVNLDICLEIQKDLLSGLEERYKIEFDDYERSYVTFRKYAKQHWTDSGSVLSVQCKKSYEKSFAVRQIYLKSRLLSQANTDFYDSGL